MCWIANRVKKPTEAKKPTADRSQKPTEAGKQKKNSCPFCLLLHDPFLCLVWRRRPFTLRLILQNLCPGGDPRDASCVLLHPAQEKAFKGSPWQSRHSICSSQKYGTSQAHLFVASMQLHAAHVCSRSLKPWLMLSTSKPGGFGSTAPSACLSWPVSQSPQAIHLLALLRAARFLPIIDCVLSQLS